MKLFEGRPDLDWELLQDGFTLAGYTPWPEAVPIHRALITPRANEHGPIPTLGIMGGGEQGGKSFCAAHHAFSRWLTDELVWLVGNRYEDCEAEYQYIRRAALKAGICKKASSGTHPDAWELEYSNGHKVKVLASEDESKLAREAPDGILMCESGRHSEAAFRALLRRAMPHRAWFFVTGTFEHVGDQSLWYPNVFTQCEDDPDGNSYRGRALSLPSYANRANYPQGQVDPAWRANVELLRRTNPRGWEDELNERFLGRPSYKTALVFSEFHRSIHVREEADYTPGLPVYLGIDPGFNSNFAVLFCQMVPLGSARQFQLRVFDEIYVRGVPNEEVLTMVTNHYSFPDLVRAVHDVAMNHQQNAETAASKRWLTELSPRGIVVTGRYSHVEAQRTRMHDKLHVNQATRQPGVTIHPRVSHLIEEFENYRLRQHRNGEVVERDDVVVGKDHAIKALTYLVMDQFGDNDRWGQTGLPKPTKERLGFQTAYA